MGRFFEDFVVDDVYPHPLGRTIIDADNVWFTLLTMNTHPLHVDYHYSEKTEFKRPLVNSGLTMAIVLGLSVGDVSQNAVANLGWDRVRLPHPVFVGDTIYAESRVLSVRESRSRPEAGIVTVQTRGFNQEGTVCIAFERTAMIYKRQHTPRPGSLPIVGAPWDEPA